MKQMLPVTTKLPVFIFIFILFFIFISSSLLFLLQKETHFATEKKPHVETIIWTEKPYVYK
jgi:hypothetical protein